jgi:hypothetical protein
LSTAETEYKAVSQVLKGTLHYGNLVEEFDIKQNYPLKMYEDNTATIAMSNNPIINKKSKHIELAYHNFKHFVQTKKVELLYISTTYQQADLLTKVVGSYDLFFSLVKMIYNLDTIVVNNVNENNNPISSTMMIKEGVDEDAELMKDLKKIYDHLKNINSGYVNSEEWKSNDIIVDEIRQKVITALINDRVFTLKELFMLQFVVADYIKKMSADYRSYFPNVFRINNANHNNGVRVTLKFLQDYHRNMEKYIIVVKHSKCIIEILGSGDSRDLQRVKWSEFKVIMQTYGYEINHIDRVNVIQTRNELNDKERNWLDADSEYQLALDHNKAFFKVYNERKVYDSRALQESLNKRKKAFPKVVWVENDLIYQDQIAVINNKDLSRAAKKDMIEQAMTQRLKDKIVIDQGKPDPAIRKPLAKISYKVTEQELNKIHEQPSNNSKRKSESSRNDQNRNAKPQLESRSKPKKNLKKVIESEYDSESECNNSQTDKDSQLKDDIKESTENFNLQQKNLLIYIFQKYNPMEFQNSMIELEKLMKTIKSTIDDEAIDSDDPENKNDDEITESDDNGSVSGLFGEEDEEEEFDEDDHHNFNEQSNYRDEEIDSNMQSKPRHKVVKVQTKESHQSNPQHKLIPKKSVIKQSEKPNKKSTAGDDNKKRNIKAATEVLATIPPVHQDKMTTRKRGKKD